MHSSRSLRHSAFAVKNELQVQMHLNSAADNFDVDAFISFLLPQ
jgi:hypothetical protein